MRDHEPKAPRISAAASTRTLLKRFVRIELHPAVYVSFIAININVFLCTVAFRAHQGQALGAGSGIRRESRLADAYLDDCSPKAMPREQTMAKQEGESAERADKNRETGESSKSSRSVENAANQDSGTETLNEAQSTLPSKSSGAPVKSKVGVSTSEHAQVAKSGNSRHHSAKHGASAYLVPPPPPMVPAFPVSSVPPALGDVAGYLSSAGYQQPAVSESAHGHHHRRLASYTVESDNFKRVIVER